MEYLIKKAYAENINAAKYYLSLAKKSKDGERWNVMSTVVYSAFSIEAYLNHVGESLKGDEWLNWDIINRPSPEQKLDRLNVKLSNEQTENFTELFQLRNIMAHGRTTVVKKNIRNPQNNIIGAMNSLSSNLETRTTLKKAESLYKSAREIILLVNDATEKVGSVQLWSLGNGSLRTS